VQLDVQLSSECSQGFRETLTSFGEFHIFGAAWLNAVDENLVYATSDFRKWRKSAADKLHYSGV